MGMSSVSENKALPQDNRPEYRDNGFKFGILALRRELVRIFSAPLDQISVRVFLALRAILLFCCVSACHREQSLDAYEDEEAYKVYASILPSTTPLILRGGTATHDFCLVPLDNQAESVLRPAIKDYLGLNSRGWLLQSKLSFPQRYTLIPEKELAAIFQKGTSGIPSRNAWKEFQQRYPTYQGWIEVSAVGFNSDKTIAIVYLGYHCGEQCEGGEFKALEKKEGRWQLFTGRGRWNHCVWATRDNSA
jgi:hypothetical protein